MIVRFGLLVAASVAAYTVRQINIKCSRSSGCSIKRSGAHYVTFLDEKMVKQALRNSKTKNRITSCMKLIVATRRSMLRKAREGRGKVKLISSILSQASANSVDVEDDDLLLEFKEFLSGEFDFPFPDNKISGEDKSKGECDQIFEVDRANNARELECLRNLVKELEERELRLEGELLEYYGLKEQESDILELQKQLKIKTVEIDILNITINSLQAERKKRQGDIAKGESAKKELEVAQYKIKELWRQIQLEANQTKGQLLLLKQPVISPHTKEEDANK
ncbi:hypothetical protein Ancab_018583 [Ancistrocladus abbreviatus]